MKTSELIGPALDWAVAKADSHGDICTSWFVGVDYHLKYSTDWSQGGPIIDREKIDTGYSIRDDNWMGGIGTGAKRIEIVGPSALVATMRCYVASKLGDEVEVPEELL